MSHTKRSASHSRFGDEWFVQGVRAYDRWSEGAEACAACSEAVDLRGFHVGIELLRRRTETGKRLYDRERAVCCSRACANVWLSD